VKTIPVIFLSEPKKVGLDEIGGIKNPFETLSLDFE
jgi:hypothetical protein